VNDPNQAEEAAVDELERWLSSLGLAQLAPVLRENDVDLEILPELHEADLEKLGLSLGQRKKLMKATASLPRRSSVDFNAAPAPSLHVTSSAERRQLTVMFCDLVGSTALASRLDPEDLREVINAYHRCVAATVARFDGFVAKYMGDGVLLYFGYPRAHEDDAERAVRAGLALVDAVGRLPVAERLRVRVGIATGLAVVGDLIGTGAAQEQAVVGETPNLAARLQTAADPDAVVIAQSTRQLVQGLFDLTDLGRHDLKGFAEPMRAWRVLGQSRRPDRFEARHARGVTPLIGREHELGLLLDRWQQAKEGDGQVVLLSGEPGIGKSRLVRALRERLADEPYTPVSHFCSPFHQTTALYPIIDLLERAAGLFREETPEESLSKLEALLARATTDVARAVPLIAVLLSISGSERYPAPSLTPQRQKEETFGVLLAQLAGLTTDQPVLTLYEDVHWADPTTLELVEQVIKSVQRLPVLVLITFRPEFIPPWHSHAHVTSLTLHRISRSRGASMVADLTRGKALPSDVLNEILAKTDGVPLFIEELTKTVLEAGLLKDEGERYALAAPLSTLAIPTTLRDSLMARLDRLGGVKEVLQVGAAIGREFGYELLAAATPLDETELQDALRRLTEAELVFARGAPPNASYMFKHALVRDAAYETQLKSRRKQLHARIAQALEQRFSEIAKAKPGVLARHFCEAGLADKAVEYGLKAGQLAIRRSAMAEAIAHLTEALNLLASLPESAQRTEQEIDLQIALGGALIAAKGHAAPETGRAYARARELCRQADDLGRLSPLMFGQWVFHMVRAEHAAAQEIAEELLRFARRDSDAAALMVGHRAAGISSLWRGDLVEAREHLEQTLALYDPERHRPLASIYVYDPRLAGLAGLAFALFQLGYPEQALARCREAVGDAERLSHPAGLAYVLQQACMLDQIRRDALSVGRRAAASIALAGEHGFALWHALGVALDGWAIAQQGRAVEGIAQIKDGLHAYRATGSALFVPYLLALLGTTCAAAGRAAEGQRLLAEALDAVSATGERWFEAELHRLKGELLGLGGDQATAEACFIDALGVAREQSAKLWELRAATSLARLWAEQRRRADARELLAPAYDWFIEGLDTPDLREAKALLNALP
jgi:class 3 adenylate cyclase/predicted ATPase